MRLDIPDMQRLKMLGQNCRRVLRRICSRQNQHVKQSLIRRGGLGSLRVLMIEYFFTFKQEVIMGKKHYSNLG